MAGVETVPAAVNLLRVALATAMHSVQQRSVSSVIPTRSGRYTVRVCAHDQQQRPKSSPTDKPTSRRDLLKGGASLGLGGIAARYAVCFAHYLAGRSALQAKQHLASGRSLRLLGITELSQVPRVLTPLMTEVSKGAQLLQQVVPKMRPTVEHLLKIGMKPTDVLRMLDNPALRPRNAAELQRWIR